MLKLQKSYKVHYFGYKHPMNEYFYYYYFICTVQNTRSQSSQFKIQKSQSNYN
jgi:hypothetical protein